MNDNQPNRQSTPEPRHPDLEICCGDLESVLAAKEGGATRIELCSGLTEGGLTPSHGLITAAVESGLPRINVLIRPRSGDFLYTPEETMLMQSDIRNAVAAGATGVVIGALTPDGDVDIATCQALVSAAREASRGDIHITFHRAFDLCFDPMRSLEDIISLGCDCLLTSGLAENAVKGSPLIRQIVDKANGRITIMAGAGVNPANAADLIRATGAGAIHSTARKPIASKMKFRRPSVSMGVPGANEYAPLSTSPDVVRTLLEITKSTPLP